MLKNYLNNITSIKKLESNNIFIKTVDYYIKIFKRGLWVIKIYIKTIMKVFITKFGKMTLLQGSLNI